MKISVIYYIDNKPINLQDMDSKLSVYWGFDSNIYFVYNDKTIVGKIPGRFYINKKE